MRYEATFFNPACQSACESRHFDGLQEAKDFVTTGIRASEAIFGCVLVAETGDVVFQVVSVVGGGVQEVAVTANTANTSNW